MAVNHPPDYYGLLGLEPSASPGQIRRAYLAEVKFWHPDRFVGRSELDLDRAREMTTRLNEAYAVLGASERRAAYDRLLDGRRSANALLAVVVSPDGRGNFRTIGEAVARAEPGTRILIEPGQYDESLVLDRRLTLIGSGSVDQVVLVSRGRPGLLVTAEGPEVRGLTLRSEGEPALLVRGGRPLVEECVLTAERAAAALSVSEPAAEPLIRRCKLTAPDGVGALFAGGARGALERCDLIGNGRAGVVSSEGASPHVRRCRVHHGKGFGVLIWRGGQGLVEECDIFANEQTGLLIAEGGRPIVRRCAVRDGIWLGVSIERNGQGIVEACDLHGNALANLAIAGGSNPLIRDCRVRDGLSTGVTVWQGGRGILEGCDIFGNARAGLAIGAGGAPVVRRCRVHDGKQGGLVVERGGGGTIEDCDLYDNAEPGLVVAAGAAPVVRSCRVDLGPPEGRSRLRPPTVRWTPLDAALRGGAGPGPDLLSYFGQRGLKTVDARGVGGGLWVIGGPELALLMGELHQQGVRASYAAQGGPATGGRAAWLIE